MHQLKLDLLREIRAVEDALRKMRAIYRALPNDAGQPAQKRVKRKAKRDDTLNLVDMIGAARAKRVRKAPAKKAAVKVAKKAAKAARKARRRRSALRRGAWTNGHHAGF